MTKIREMKKQTLTVIALVLMLTMGAFLAITSPVNAAVLEINTYATVTAVPDPVQVNQHVIVTYRIDKLRPDATVRANHWTGFTVAITKPDNSVETRTGLEVDATSAGWLQYVPNQIGTYKFHLTFDGQWYNTTSTQYWYKPSSADISITVQEDPIPGYEKSPPLPTEPWTRPIYSENKGWWQIADNWLMPGFDYDAKTFTISSAFAPYTSAPNSPHVLWNKPIIFGGMAGGQFADKDYYTGLSYEQFYTPMILNGRIIYIDHGPTGTTAFGTRVLDLYTGEQIYFLDGVSIAFAQILDIETPNEHGLLTYLWSVSGSNWIGYDAFSGRQIMNITGMGSGSASRRGVTRFGPNGELLVYQLGGTAPNQWLAMWNVTRTVLGLSFGAGIDVWSPGSTAINASRRLDENPGSVGAANRAAAEARSHSPYMGVEWNVTIPALPENRAQGISTITGTYVLTSNTTGISAVIAPIYHALYDVNIDQQDDGSYPASINYLWAELRSDVAMGSYKMSNIEDGAYAMFDEGQKKFHTYSVTNGKELWTGESYGGWSLFTYLFHIAYGKLYSAGFDGHVRAFDVNNGTLVWDYYMGNAGYETAYGSWPTYSGFEIADGKLYVTNDEHSPDAVMWRGAKLTCLDAETGDLLWSVSGMLRHAAISDGILTALNSYDGQVYTFGKGPSKTTVSAPQTQVTLGDKVIISGTVTDQTPASKDTPAISDESMAAWMEYLYMQKVYPANATGVEVTIDVLDSNNNYYNIGTATSDASGFYSFEWAPEIPGKFLIFATFAGSNSYGSSFAETAMTVAEAPPASPTPPPLTLPPTETYIGVGTGLIIVAIAIVGLLLFKKR